MLALHGQQVAADEHHRVPEPLRWDTSSYCPSTRRASTPDHRPYLGTQEAAGQVLPARPGRPASLAGASRRPKAATLAGTTRPG